MLAGCCKGARAEDETTVSRSGMKRELAFARNATSLVINAGSREASVVRERGTPYPGASDSDMHPASLSDRTYAEGMCGSEDTSVTLVRAAARSCFSLRRREEKRRNRAPLY